LDSARFGRILKERDHLAEHPTIKKGSKGAAVKLAQKRLVMRYYDPGPIDSLFGAKTEKAVKQYQGDRLLSNDGIIGPKTWARLDPPTVKNGSSGEAVKLAQQLLTDYGYDPGSVDSAFGPKTEKAVKQFQTDFGLTVDGIVGPKTWAMLGS
jgi:peptidoglycan hydrolase-like protein with peptidoglycan-binding domain